MESELRALQQQAEQTHQSLKTLQNHSSAGPAAALPGFDGALLGMAGGFAIALALLWWYLWHRPQMRLMSMAQVRVAKKTAPAKLDPVSDFEDSHNPAAFQPSQAEPRDDTVAQPASQEQQEPDEGQTVAAEPPEKYHSDVGFDPEAAAGEVMRVRKSLADKREARAYILEREDGDEEEGQAGGAVHAWLESGSTSGSELGLVPPPAPAAPGVQVADPWSHPAEASYDTGSPPIDIASEVDFSFILPDEPHDAPPAADSVADMSPDTEPRDEPESDQTQVLDSAMEYGSAPTSEPAPQPDLEPEPEEAQWEHEQPVEPDLDANITSQDYAVTLALAEECAELELWPEARELAVEVLASDNEVLRSAAQSLLERLKELEIAMVEEDIPWQEAR